MAAANGMCSVHIYSWNSSADFAKTDHGTLLTDWGTGWGYVEQFYIILSGKQEEVCLT